MKLFRNIATALILLSPLAAAAQSTESEPVSRDSIMVVVQAAKASDPEALNIMGTWYYLGQNLEQDYTLAARMWAKAASMGNVEAIGNLGVCYQYGRGVEADSVKAMGLYTKSLRMGNQELFDSIRREADLGHPFECAVMGHFLSKGIGCKKNYGEAATYYVKLAKLGDVDAMREAALCYLNGKDYKNALTWFKKGTEAGDTTSTYYYGLMLADGMGVKPDPAMGFVYARKAADEGMAAAQLLVSRLYREGRGVDASATEANRWLRLAAYNNNARAMFDYAELSARQNNYIAAAYMMSCLQARNSYVPQLKALFTPTDTTNLLNTPFGHFALALKAIEKADFKAAKAQIKALKKAKIDMADILDAQILLNPAYDKHNVHKGIKQLTKLAEKSDYARLILAGIYLRGIDGVEVDVIKARQLLEQASANGFTPADIALGNAYYEGLLGVTDYENAVEYYGRAYQSGMLLADAAGRYATCLDEGNGTILKPALAATINALKYPSAIVDFLRLVP